MISKDLIKRLESSSDHFYFDWEVEEVVWVYYNPDSLTGGQLVYAHVPFDTLLEAVNDGEYDMTEIAQPCKQYLSDITEPDFETYAEQFFSTDFGGRYDTALIRTCALKWKSWESLTEVICKIIEMHKEDEETNPNIYRIPVEWAMSGVIEVKAENREEAIELAREMPLPKDGTYIEDSMLIPDYAYEEEE